MKLLLMLLISCLILSCSDNKTTDTTKAKEAGTSTLLNTQMDALEKTKSVEQSLHNMTEARELEMRKKGT